MRITWPEYAVLFMVAEVDGGVHASNGSSHCSAVQLVAGDVIEVKDKLSSATIVDCAQSRLSVTRSVSSLAGPSRPWLAQCTS